MNNDHPYPTYAMNQMILVVNKSNSEYMQMIHH